jgi:hypothetical protein
MDLSDAEIVLEEGRDTHAIMNLFQQICIVLAKVQYTRHGFYDIKDLRIRLHSYYGIHEPISEFHIRIQHMSNNILGDIASISNNYLNEDEKESIQTHLKELEKKI